MGEQHVLARLLVQVREHDEPSHQDAADAVKFGALSNGLTAGVLINAVSSEDAVKLQQGQMQPLTAEAR